MSDKKIPIISTQYTFPPLPVPYQGAYPTSSSPRNPVACTVRTGLTQTRNVAPYRAVPLPAKPAAIVPKVPCPVRYQYPGTYYDYSSQNVPYQNYQAPYTPQQQDYYKHETYQPVSYDTVDTQSVSYDPSYYQNYPSSSSGDYSTCYYPQAPYSSYSVQPEPPSSTVTTETKPVEVKKDRTERKEDDYKKSERRNYSSTKSGSASSSRYSRTRSSKHTRSPSREHRSSRKSPSKMKFPPTKSNSKSERDLILEKWRKNYCATSEEVTNKLKELSEMTQEEILEREKSFWTRTTPGDLFYVRDDQNPKVVRGTSRLQQICERFNEDLVLRANTVNSVKEPYNPPERKKRTRLCKHKSEPCHSDSSSNDDFSDEEEENIMEELTRKQQHPDRLHAEMWYNDPGEMNDGPLCRCSLKSRKSGIRHGIYAGEQFLKLCDKDTNNANQLYHYKITISPPTNFLTKTPTIIKHDEHEFIFEGFSMFSHFPLVKLPTCKVIRFNIEYTILYIEEKHPDNFTIRELDLFHDFLFREMLELVDLDFKAAGDVDGCAQFHFMPRFVRELPDNGREILSMKEVLQYLLDSSELLIQQHQLESMVQMSQYEWQAFADEVKGMVVTFPGKKPCSVRVDQLDRNTDLQVKGQLNFPEIVHFGIRPPQLSYAGNPEYQKAWRDYVKFRHLLANMSKPTYEDKRKLEQKEAKLQEMRTQSKMKRDVTVAVSAEGFYKTGIMCDIVQHAMLIPVLVCHLRFHHSLNILEKNINYKFQNRALLQLALTHPSYRENFGTNPDHARNSLTNCGIRQPEYGDRRIHYMNTRKRGINTLINIMSRFGKKHETESNITHNERLEFLGDAVVEFLSSIHLFLMFPDLEEGGLATYRAAIVQNQHLAVLARILDLDQFMLYAHGSDLCHDLELRHAMANCFEALMGALFLDGGIEVADKVFGETFFKKDSDLLEVWVDLPKHPLQEQEPNGDRQWIPKFEVLQKLVKFEEATGIQFRHIRLLARAFTDRSIGYTNLTLGSNQRLEFLGDTVLQLIASEYLYKYFPEHHEGHLSLLRSSLVNNRTQAVVCDDLGMANYAVYNNPKAELKTKDRADLLEAYLGAVYIDSELEDCRRFCQVTLFPRLREFIVNQDWNDPKSKLQQCCLTLRTMDGGEPDIPVYKVIECKGPTNTRVYTVAVYFRNRRLAKATGHSIQQAEMNAAKQALENSQDLFPQLDHQRRVIAKSMKKQKYPHKSRNDSDITNSGDEDIDEDLIEADSQSRSPSPTSNKLSKYRREARKGHKTRKRNRSERSNSRSPNRERISCIEDKLNEESDNSNQNIQLQSLEKNRTGSVLGTTSNTSDIPDALLLKWSDKKVDVDRNITGSTDSTKFLKRPSTLSSSRHHSSSKEQREQRKNTDDRRSVINDDRKSYDDRKSRSHHRHHYHGSSRHEARSRERSKEPRRDHSSHRRRNRAKDSHRRPRSRSRETSKKHSHSRPLKSDTRETLDSLGNLSDTRSYRSQSHDVPPGGRRRSNSFDKSVTEAGELSVEKLTLENIHSDIETIDESHESSKSGKTKDDLSVSKKSVHIRKNKKDKSHHKSKKEMSQLSLDYFSCLAQLKEDMICENATRPASSLEDEGNKDVTSETATEHPKSFIEELKKRNILLFDDLSKSQSSSSTSSPSTDEVPNSSTTNTSE